MRDTRNGGDMADPMTAPRPETPAPLPRCANCLYWSGLYDHGNGQLTGDCRRRAPVCGGTSELTYTAWPTTPGHAWCGEWEGGGE